MAQPIDSRQLRAFSTLARTGSFTQAAKELYLSQSAVSHSMKALEQDLGCRLFDRMGKKVLLTQAGEQLMQHAEKILLEMHTARDSLKQLGQWGRGRLRIGASSTACQYILPAVLRKFKEQFPKYLISIEPVDSADSVELLKQNRIDLALTLESKSDEAFDFISLFEDNLMFVTCPVHPWAISNRVIRTEIPKQQYVLYNKNSYTFRRVEEYFSREQMVLDMVIELGSMDAIKELTKLGLGVSILAPWIAQKELAESSLVALPLGRRKLRRTWGIMHWKSRRLNLAEETFISMCRSICESMPSSDVE